MANISTTPTLAMKGNILFYNDYQYFINYKSDCYLYRKKNDNSGLSKISSAPVNSFEILNDRIYYSKGTLRQSTHPFLKSNSTIPSGGLYSMNLDGTGYKLVNNHRVNGICIIDNKIFYSLFASSGMHYLQLNADKVTTKSIPVDGTVNRFCDYGDYIFYIVFNNNNNKMLYRMDTYGGNKTKLNSSEKVSSFFIYDDWVYFEETNYNPISYGYKKMKIDGTECQSTTKDEYYSNESKTLEY